MAQSENSGKRGKSVPRAIRRNLVLSTALASAAFLGYGSRGAYAGSCTLFGGSYNCSGPANAVTDVTQILNPGTVLTVFTASGFGMDTSSGNALSIGGQGSLSFADNFNSSITGYNTGIFTRNRVSGRLFLTATGLVTGVVGDGIYARNEGTDLTLSAASVSGGNNGIEARNEGSSALRLTATGLVAGAAGDGIYARNEGTYLTISAASVSGGDDGIYALNEGSGALNVTATGMVTGAGDDGIRAVNFGTDLTVSVSGVSGATDGLNAFNLGTGALHVTATGMVTGTNRNGLYIDNATYGTDLTISVADVTGARRGIRARNYGSGALSVTASGQVTGTRDVGIYALNSTLGMGTDLVIAATGVSGGNNGIEARNEGSGALNVTATGPVAGAAGDGIYARNEGTDLTISAASVSGGDDGIEARNIGSGALNVTATGLVAGAAGDGIYARNEGTDLTISAASVSGGDDGIEARNIGSGALNVTATGPVTGTSRNGLYIDNAIYGTDLTISVADVTAARIGIRARNYGSGALSVTASGQVTGTRDDGIYALNSAFGTDLTIVATDVSGGTDGIDALNYGTGTLSVAVDGTVEGGTGYGIRAQTGLGDSAVITLNAGAAVSAASGLAISNNEGDSETTVNAGASVTGEIRLGNGRDDLTFNGGNFSGVTVFDGGDDASSADGFVDTLTLQNVTGSVAGASVINWENVVVDMNGTITFTDNALETERLDAVNGGKVSMKTGAAENFQLTGDFGTAGAGGLVLEVFSPADFDTFDVLGFADFSSGGAFDFLFDAGFDPFDGLELIFLTSDGISGFDFLDFSFIGLDPLFSAFVGLGPQEDTLFLSFNRRDPNPNPTAVPEPGMLTLFGAGLLGLFGLRRIRRRQRIAA